jgi:hypothetical protein
MVFGDVKGQPSRIAFIGDNWDDAVVKKFERVPEIEEAFSRVGNHITADEMQYLMNNRPNLYHSIDRRRYGGAFRLYALNQCVPECTRNRPGHLSFIPPRAAGGRAPHFKRLPRKCGEGNCTETEQEEVDEIEDVTTPSRQSAFIRDRFIIRWNRNQGFAIDRHQAVVHGWPPFLSEENRHDIIEDIRAKDGMPFADNEQGAILRYTNPLVGSLDISVLPEDSDDWPVERIQFKINHFARSPRFFVGELRAQDRIGNYRASMEERHLGTDSKNHMLGLSPDNCVLIWLPTHPNLNEDDDDLWTNRVVEQLHDTINQAIDMWDERNIRINLSTHPNYPGYFLFVESAQPFFSKPTIGQMFQDMMRFNQVPVPMPVCHWHLSDMRFFWPENNTAPGANQLEDDGSRPELYAEDGRIDLLVMLPPSRSETDGDGRTVKSYKNPEFGIMLPNGNRINAITDAQVDEAGFCWLSFRFQRPGHYFIGIRGNHHNRMQRTQIPRYISVTVPEGDDQSVHPVEIFMNPEEGDEGWHSLGIRGTSSRTDNLDLINDNSEYLLGGCYADLDWTQELDEAHKKALIQDITRAVYNQYVGHGNDSITGSTWSRKARQLSYFIQLTKYPDSPVVDFPNLGDLNRELSEFKYAAKPVDQPDSAWRWVARETTVQRIPIAQAGGEMIQPSRIIQGNPPKPPGGTAQSHSSKHTTEWADWFILYDSRSNQMLLQEYGNENFKIDWESGVRLIHSSIVEHAGMPILDSRPDMDSIAPSAGAWLCGLWESIKENSHALPTNGDGVVTFRWSTSEEATYRRVLNGRTRIRQDMIDRIQWDPFTPPPILGGNQWRLVDDFRNASALEIPDGRLFLHLAVQRPDVQMNMAGRTEWGLYLGHFSLVDGQETGVLIGSSSFLDDKERIDWIDEIGHTKTENEDARIDLHFLRYPDSSGWMLDMSYLIRETFRAFNVLSGVEIPNEQQGGQGLPGWAYNHPQMVASAIERLFALENERVVELQNVLTEQLRSRCWW